MLSPSVCLSQMHVEPQAAETVRGKCRYFAYLWGCVENDDVLSGCPTLYPLISGALCPPYMKSSSAQVCRLHGEWTRYM